jgi:hypothetical protein
MKPTILSATCALAAAAPVLAQEADPFDIPNPNRFSLGARVSFNYEAKFSTARPNPGPATGNANRFYEDGYVRPDKSGNAGGLTWNWGYDQPEQVAGDSIEFHRVDSAVLPSTLSKSSDEAYYGMELVYQRLLGTFGSGGGWGFEGAFSYSDFELQEKRSATGPGTLLIDAYFLNGVLPPNAPYRGSFQGPGPLLGATPSRTITDETVSVANDHRLEGLLFGFRIGPFIEWNFSRAFSVSLSGGIALSPAMIDYEFSESVSLESGRSTLVRGKSTKEDLLYGNYVAGTLRYQFTKNWGVYAGAQFQTLNDLEQTVRNRTARLESGATFHGVAGVSYKF